jgi:hypothetical protein
VWELDAEAPPAKRGPTPKLQQQVERLSRLPQAKQRVVMEMLEGFLNQTARGPKERLTPMNT